jgi:hypothetical protein
LWELGSGPEFTRRRGACGRLERQRGAELNPRFAGDSACEHRNPTGWYRYTTRRNRYSTNHSRANARLYFAQWNSEHDYAGIDVPEQFDSRKHHATIHG